MKRKLLSLAKELSDTDVKELLRLRRLEDKKSVGLRRKRDKLAAEIAKIDAQLAKIGSDDAPVSEAKPRRARKAATKAAPKKRGRKAKAKPAAAPAKKAAGPRGRKAGKKSRRLNISGTVRQIFADAGTPLKASQVVDALPGAGVAVKDVADMRKRISVVLASQKNHFEAVERGVYRLKD